MIPTSDGGNPRQNPATPSFSRILLNIAIGAPRAFPRDADVDWSWVFTTSIGFVIHDANVPATPPDNKLYIC